MWCLQGWGGTAGMWGENGRDQTPQFWGRERMQRDFCCSHTTENTPLASLKPTHKDLLNQIISQIII